ncbi:MAG: radical SAM family heme chaperone HemW [Candidatus Omnitrophica bacterium]|nr:radical SAM family heme chaperone HemW [Candidatus Omnitrophota bacterium]
MDTSLYIHIPFCRQRCIYCDFYSAIYKENVASEYIDVIIEQTKNLAYSIPTLYIGGGTPTVLSREIMTGLLKSLAKYSEKASEFTIEANPESLTEDKLKLMRDLGVNRISIGVQSFDGRKLKALGRIHTAKKAEDAVRMASRNGFKNISIDIIFGAWMENPESWKKELDKAAALPVTHVSCYGLTYEKSAPLFQAVKNKSVVPLDDEVVASMYECAIETLSVRGFKQYEVSNFAKEGFRCLHNIRYWDNEPYVGLGASAVSYIDGVRAKNVADVAEYIERFHDNRFLIESSEKLSPLRRAKETAAIKIRTKDGVDFKWFRDKTGFDFQELEHKVLPRLVEDGLVKYIKEDNIPTGIALKRKGFLFCDTVSSALL